MVLIIVLAVLGIWILVSALLLIGICAAASKYNQFTGQSEERYFHPDQTPDKNPSPSSPPSKTAEWSVSPTTPRRNIQKETG